jgi:general secretion pathway protein M
MIATLLLWWQARSARERRLIAMMLALAAGLLLWVGVYRPVNAALEDARVRHEQAVANFGAIKARVDLLGRNDTATLSATITPEALVSAIAEEGFVAEPPRSLGPGKVELRVSSARATALLGWLARLEAGGVRVETAQVAPASGMDTVAMQAVLAVPGSP